MVDMKKAQIISWACILSGVPSSPRPPEPSQGFLTTRATLGLSIASFPSVGSSWERMEDKDSVLLCKLEEAVGYSFENRKFLREAVLTPWIESTHLFRKRLECVGISVWECVLSLHLFHLFPELDEGSLSLYRQSLNSKQMLDKVGQSLNLEEFCQSDHKADTVESVMKSLLGALYLDGGLDPCKQVSSLIFNDDPSLVSVWKKYPLHPLQSRHPDGDRHLIQYSPYLQELVHLEQSIDIQFKHISVLARAFTRGFNLLTFGNMETLEFLGDAVLKLVAAENAYYYVLEKKRNCSVVPLVEQATNREIQAEIAKELCLHRYVYHGAKKANREVVSSKGFSNLLEAFFGALMVDQGLRCATQIFQKHFTARLEIIYGTDGTTCRKRKIPASAAGSKKPRRKRKRTKEKKK